MTGWRISQYATLVWCWTPAGHCVPPDIKEHTHTHSESIQWRRALLVLPMWLFFQKQHLAQISQQPLSRWCSNCHPCSILSHRQIRKCCKSPQSHLFMHVWSLLSCSKAYRSFRSRPQTVLHDQCRGELSQIHDSAPFKLGCKAFLNYVTNLLCTSFAVLWLWRILNFKCCILTLILYDSTAKNPKSIYKSNGISLMEVSALNEGDWLFSVRTILTYTAN